MSQYSICHPMQILMLLDKLFSVKNNRKSVRDECFGMTKTPDKRINVLVVSLPGLMQNMLCETLDNKIGVDVIGVASGGLSAVSMIQKHQPDLVVIDSNLPVTEAKALILWMREEFQHVLSIILVETTQQLKQASSIGADFSLRSYSFSENLDGLLERLRTDQISQQGNI